MATEPAPDFNAVAPRATPEQIVDEALDVIEKFSIQNARSDGTPFIWHRSPPQKIDWKKLRETARAELASVGTPTVYDACGVIDRVLMRLHDRHSMLMHPQFSRCMSENAVEYVSWIRQKNEFQRPRKPGSGDRPQKMPEVEYIENGTILKLTVPWFMIGSPGADSDLYRDILLNALKGAKEKGVKGVVVDLRENCGGSMCPMISGLSPLLGSGTLGYFEGPDKKERRDVSYGPREMTMPLDHPDVNLLVDMPVAVLQGPTTCSSGEIVVQSFSGRPRTRTFGKPTDGNTSGNKAIPLNSEKDLVVLICSSRATDRNGKGDGGPIAPDVETDRPLEEAVRWIQDGAPGPKIDRQAKAGSAASPGRK